MVEWKIWIVIECNAEKEHRTRCQPLKNDIKVQYIFTIASGWVKEWVDWRQRCCMDCLQESTNFDMNQTILKQVKNVSF